MAMAVLEIKAGDTLAWSSARTDAAGNAVSLSGVTLASSFTGSNGTIAPSYNILSEAGGTFEITAPASTTETWTPGVYVGDLTFTDGLGVQSTETFAVTVLRSYP